MLVFEMVLCICQENLCVQTDVQSMFHFPFLYFVCTQSCYRIILNSTVNPPLKHNPPRSILACIPIKRGDLYMDRIIWYHNPYFV